MASVSLQTQLKTHAAGLLTAAQHHPVKAMAAAASALVAIPAASLAIQSYRINNTLESLGISDYQITTKLGQIWNATFGRIGNALCKATEYMRPIFNPATDKEVDSALQIMRQANDGTTKISPPNLIIYGEPGVGKTEVIKYMCLKAGVSFICIPPGAMEVHIANGTHITFLNTVLHIAKKSVGPVCLILNDGEELVATRHTIDTKLDNVSRLSWERKEEDLVAVIKDRRNALVNTILELAGTQNNKVFFAVTTNRPHKIDSAFKTRATSFGIFAPGPEERKEIIHAHLPRVFENNTNLLRFFHEGTLTDMAKSTEGFTGRNLVKMLEQLYSNVKGSNYKIREDQIHTAILQTRPSANARTRATTPIEAVTHSADATLANGLQAGG